MKIKKQKIKWIYETPDKGKTLYKRPFEKYYPRYLVKVGIFSVELN